MKVSKEAQHYIDRCYMNGIPVVVTPMFNVKYRFDETEVKFTESILAEIIESELVIVTNQNDKQVTLKGIG